MLKNALFRIRKVVGWDERRGKNEFRKYRCLLRRNEWKQQGICIIKENGRQSRNLIRSNIFKRRYARNSQQISYKCNHKRILATRGGIIMNGTFVGAIKIHETVRGSIFWENFEKIHTAQGEYEYMQKTFLNESTFYVVRMSSERNMLFTKL